MFAHRLICFVIFAIATDVIAQAPRQLTEELAQLAPRVLSDELRERFQGQAWRILRARGDEANRNDVETWRTIQARKDWEQLRDEKLKRLEEALGGFPQRPESINVHVTRKVEGEGFVIENLVYETRPGFWVTANLYRSSPPREKMPGILIAHSHHRPKTQEELQDMGMTWARKGCLVLVIDQVGHGERADHPFQSESDYKKKDSDFRWWRQDYYHRFDTNAQLHLVGQSLMGWMAWDLMRGVDLLLERPGIDPDRILLLGAVAGGGDPAAVTVALDRRIDAAVPFNFGGPQPETRFPLPEDADLHFNYLGGAYWEGTRNLRRTGVDGFFHWLIVASIAPRPLVYAHEFAWDKEHDPVWKRLQKIYGFYDAGNNIDYTLGRGSVKGRPPEATHCTNIGSHHRQRIHAAFHRWFDIQVTADDEYSQPVEAEVLRSMTDEAAENLKPQKLHTILTQFGQHKVMAARAALMEKSLPERRKQLRADWNELLGQVTPGNDQAVLSRKRETAAADSVVVERIALQTEPGIVIPLILLHPEREQKPTGLVVAVAQSGKAAFLRERAEEIAELLQAGAAVCLVDVRGANQPRGSRGELGSSSYYALFFETPLVGQRLRDLRAVLKYLRTRNDLAVNGFSLWGESFAPANPRDTDFQVPKRVSGRPHFSEPLGGLLAMLTALYEDDIKAVYVRGSLSSYQDVLTGPYVYIPHDVVIPGVLTKGDLVDLAASLAPCRLCLDRLVDGLNRPMSSDDVRLIYEPIIKAYKSKNAAVSFSPGDSLGARWLLDTLKR
jgi:dienelactone hydrolase